MKIFGIIMTIIILASLGVLLAYQVYKLVVEIKERKKNKKGD